MSSLLPLTASFIILLFLYSSGSYPSNKQATTATPADKGLLRTTELNAHLSPHIYNVFNTPKLEITTSDACVEQAKQFCTEPLHTGLVTYAESSTQWTVCHCDSQDAWSYLVNHLSRLPLALRTHIHTIMLAPLPPSTSSPHAHFTRSPPTATFFGHPTIGTWVHEFAHAVDVHHSTVLFSSSAYWTTALEKDSCVVDAYARTSREEVCLSITPSLLLLISTGPSSSCHRQVVPRWKTYRLDSIPQPSHR